jgi:6-phospho-3-hexuloisomerase
MTLQERIEVDLLELQELARKVDPGEGERLGDLVLRARRVFVIGKGRSGLVMEMLAMRLMQLGLTVFVVGEATTPAIAEGDVLIGGSGSGETPGVLSAAKRAKGLGAKVAAITSRRESSLGKVADTVVLIPGETTKLDMNQSSKLPLGTILEQALLVFVDSLSAHLAEGLGHTNETMMALHANME